MSKMGSHDPFEHFKHKLCLKVRNRPDFLACKWRATYRWKAFDEGYNFASYLISIEGLHTKLWPPKVVGVPILEFRDSHLGVPKQNDI
jgi:hypothetical protein